MAEEQRLTSVHKDSGDISARWGHVTVCRSVLISARGAQEGTRGPEATPPLPGARGHAGIKVNGSV